MCEFKTLRPKRLICCALYVCAFLITPIEATAQTLTADEIAAGVEDCEDRGVEWATMDPLRDECGMITLVMAQLVGNFETKLDQCQDLLAEDDIAVATDTLSKLEAQLADDAGVWDGEKAATNQKLRAKETAITPELCQQVVNGAGMLREAFFE